MSKSVAINSKVVPGTQLGTIDSYLPGPGTYINDGFIYASLLGYVNIVVDEEPTDNQKLPQLTVQSLTQNSLIPQVGSIVLAKVMRLLPTVVGVKILVCDGKPCNYEFPAIIRPQDVRLAEIAKLEIHNCFRPGDIIRAEVISLGDSKFYLLSTAKNELGVVIATSPTGETMVPINWQQMMCPKTRVVEFRKCAKPV